MLSPEGPESSFVWDPQGIFVKGWTRQRRYREDEGGGEEDEEGRSPSVVAVAATAVTSRAGDLFVV